MPQMAPMSWLTLFLLFTLSLIIMMTINYYLFIPKMQVEEHNKNFYKKTMNWKW
uniref:ATP synthase complex subunit 8 n=1 Tax=Ischnura pumilio TaxID=638490 RepID=R9XYF6_9ODON|nr:ATP synthase F0 subunit 8 [Ischnura pumilio]AGO19356.1 ATPase subunit 8 [Ischnura pumilio]